MTDGDRDCEKCEELLQGYLDRELTAAEVVVAEGHLNACDYYRRRYRFEEHLRRGTFSVRVGQDVNTAGEAGVAGTPSFFVNDVRYRGAHEFDALEASIARASRMGALRDRRAAELAERHP